MNYLGTIIAPRRISQTHLASTVLDQIDICHERSVSQESIIVLINSVELYPSSFFEYLLDAKYDS